MSFVLFGSRKLFLDTDAADMETFFLLLLEKVGCAGCWVGTGLWDVEWIRKGLPMGFTGGCRVLLGVCILLMGCFRVQARSV